MKATESLKIDTSLIFKKRRRRLVEELQKKYPEVQKGLVVLFANFEQNLYSFRQESSFYYFSGITEPGSIMLLYFGGQESDGKELVYITNAGDERQKWVNVTLQTDQEDGGKSAQAIGVFSIKPLGKQIQGYSISSIFHEDEHEHVLHDVQSALENGYTLFTLLDPATSLYDTQKQRYFDFMHYMQKGKDKTIDASYVVHEMRKTKGELEISLIQKAVDITADAQRSAAKAIRDGVKEYQVRASLEFEFTNQHVVRPSFPSIVATGRNTTVLHYTELNQELKDGDLVVVDIGAEFGYYAADITRTYPVSGKFTKRQRQVYEVVLQTQEYAFSIAKPGMYLLNPEKKDQSLHHLAVAFLQERGFEKYFVHGLGHFLGLDVHDIGDYSVPFQAGDVFTIEPGVYIREENLGVRIEDDYVITQDGCRCLSASLPKSVQEVEEMMK